MVQLEDILILMNKKMKMIAVSLAALTLAACHCESSSSNKDYRSGKHTHATDGSIVVDNGLNGYVDISPKKRSPTYMTIKKVGDRECIIVRAVKSVSVDCADGPKVNVNGG